jgi:hypothetical protein
MYIFFQKVSIFFMFSEKKRDFFSTKFLIFWKNTIFLNLTKMKNLPLSGNK